MSGSETASRQDELVLLSDSVRDFCARGLAIERLTELSTNGRSFDEKTWTSMLELGFADAALSESQGGLGYGAAGVARIARELGRVVAREPFLETGVAALSILAAIDPQRAENLRDDGLTYTLPLTQATWGQSASVSASKNDHGFLLNGMLRDIANIDCSTRILIPVELDRGVALFDLELASLSEHVKRNTLADGSISGDIVFDNFVLESNGSLVSSSIASDTIEAAFSLLGIGVSAYLLGLSESLLERTLEYLRTREQFGRAIGSFQALQHRAVDWYMQNRLANAALENAIELLDSGVVASSVSARARERACHAARLSAREAIQLHGAIGYTAEHDVAFYAWRMLVMVARFGRAKDELKQDEEFMVAAATGADSSATIVDASIADYQQAPQDWNALDDEQFRAVVRDLLHQYYPKHMCHLAYQVRWSEIREWHEQLVALGWAAPAWPREYGGMGLDTAKLLIYIEEFERHGVARAPDQGIVMLGPILFAHGNEEQRARFLPGALSGEQIWCQGYSEPNAGSDLASLATRAVLDGDEFVVSGQKTWTTHGLDATHMYCLVRTDPNVKPQAGISFLLIDLDQVGVEVRPIPNLGGHVDFCEVFLDEVRVPAENLIGEINQGWTIAKALLGHERLFVGSPKLCQHALNQMRELAQHRALMEDPIFVDALVDATLDVVDLEALYGEYAELAKAGKPIGADIALLKIWSTETYARLSELILHYAGGAAANVGGSDAIGIDALAHYYNARPAPIYAGSNEIQRNIIAKHVLQMPT